MKKIIYKHETSKDFHMSSVIGLSDFLNFEKNPAFMHFYQNRENNQMTNFGADFCLSKEESMSFRFSEPILELLTDPETFFSTYVTVPKIDTRSEKGKMELKNFMDQTKNFIHLSAYQMDLVSKAASVIKMDEKILLINRKNDKNFYELPMYKLNDGYGYIGPNTSYLIRLIDHSNGYIRPFEKFGKQEKKIELFPQLILIHE